MNHYVVYHSAEKMGHSFRDHDDAGSEVPTEFSIVTSKKPDRFIDNVIWLISGEGQPRDYRLEYWFIVVGFERIDGDEFSYRVFGTKGAILRGIPLNKVSWFGKFRTSQANFSLGVQPIAEEFVTRFCSLAAARRFATPVDPAVASAASNEKAGGPAARRKVVTDQLLRDSAIVRQVKEIHAFTCQVCGVRLQTPAGPYAECAHIRPLGSPHNGPDVVSNVLCLCPNDHILFDTGTFSILDDMTFVGRKGVLRVAQAHRVNCVQLSYHRTLLGADPTLLPSSA
jgi:hypothetical protein